MRRPHGRNVFHEWARETANETAAREERFHEWARETANETAAREERHNKQLEKLNGAFTNIETRVDCLLDTVKNKSQSDM